MPKPPTRMTWRIPGGEIILDEDGCHLHITRMLEEPEAVEVVTLYNEIRTHAAAGRRFGKPVPPTPAEARHVSATNYYRRAQAIMQQAIDDEIRG